MKQEEFERNQEMYNLRFTHGKTLQEIASQFGVSRERVRQIIGNTGREFRVNWTKKKFMEYDLEAVSDISSLPGVKSVWQKVWGSYRHPNSNSQGIEFEEMGNALLISKGFETKLMPHLHPFDILVNGEIKIDVKHSDFDISTLESQNSTGPTYPISHLKGGKDCDLFLVFVPLGEEYSAFIIPSYEVAGLDKIRIPWPSGKKPSKWHKYLNRFDLLSDGWNK